MRFVSLGSGSKGNALLVHAGTTRILIDCGFGVRALSQRLARVGCILDQLDAVFVTHEHSDHVAGLAALQRRTGCPVHLTEGTHCQLRERQRLSGPVHEVRANQAVTVGDLQVTPYGVPHDAAEPVQFVISDGACRLGVLTDAGSVTGSMVEALRECNGLVIEFNHDADLLRDGPYPAFLKRRIASDEGHLDNEAAAHLLGELKHPGLQHVLGAHLSEQNNRPELVRAGMSRALGASPQEMCVADQAEGSDWFSLTG
ncbi:MBL fold metallo-hydrolase [Nitrogeniibacter mangrovi]|uniref:MBL fold metallo-hydrolase n=1 Tax=Nitrogeniibacter mangrovi TaxID=2016596 RepID=A0A6C1B8K1_9RHOO|nr:MBL fold metallo-hydrolase [Nitrogeniibacter mangrovi]